MIDHYQTKIKLSNPKLGPSKNIAVMLLSKLFWLSNISVKIAKSDFDLSIFNSGYQMIACDFYVCIQIGFLFYAYHKALLSQ